MPRNTFSGLSVNLSGIYNVRETELLQEQERQTIKQQVNYEDNNKKQKKLVQCIVYFLDDSSHIFEIDKRSKGQLLLDQVFQYLELIEKDYFGLQYIYSRSQQPNQNYLNNNFFYLTINNSSNSNLNTDEVKDVWKWLDIKKSIKRQLKSDPPYNLYFRVRFFVSDPTKLQEEYTRYHYFMQLRKNIFEEKLILSHSSKILLASYAVQSELGDYSFEEHKNDYLSNLKLFQNQNSTLLDEICKLHKAHKGQTPADAEFNFLNHAKNLDMYGIELHKGKNISGCDILIGVSSKGIVIFELNIKVNTFSWSKIIKISFKRKYFFVQMRKENQNEKIETLVGFNLISYKQCKTFWKSCVEHHTFFRLQIAKPQTKKFFFFFSLGSKFRYSGKTEFQTMEESKKRLRQNKNFARCSSKRYARQTVACLYSPQKTINLKKKNINLSITNSINDLTCTVSNGSFWQNSSKLINGIYCSVLRKNNFSNELNSKIKKSNGIDCKNLSSKSNNELKNSFSLNMILNENNKNKLNNGLYYQSNVLLNNINEDSLNSSLLKLKSNKSLIFSPKPTQNHVNRTSNSAGSITLSNSIVTLNNCSISKNHVVECSSKIAQEVWNKDERKELTALTSINYALSNVQDLNNVSRISIKSPLSVQNTNIKKNNTSFHSNQLLENCINEINFNENNFQYIDCAENETDIIDALTSMPAVSSNNITNKLNNVKNLRLKISNDDSVKQTLSLIKIKIKPDDQGRFGFNVKGGADQNMPILVSRVAPNTPADNCSPKLNEGDQVISVNNVLVERLIHDQVIKLIKSENNRSANGELVLIIRPNVYNHEVCSDKLSTDKEIPFQYIPVDLTLSSKNKFKNNKLNQSIMLIAEGLESGSLITQFEKNMYIIKENEEMNFAKLQKNLIKNRYIDISPYDSTRVKITNSLNDDYINASYVNMKIPSSGIINRYIATQGPLPNTCDDFWKMVWEQKSALIVMVTPLIENSMVKCHKYWPDLNETFKYNSDMKLICTKQIIVSSMIEREFSLSNENEKRVVIHLQYTAWPDHGVPNDSRQFLELIKKVRQYRCGMVEPIIVHCSAGIGRTGVLILMETAICLIEANEPIYPLEILRSMRDQRGRLIQTSSQFRFVLEAIYKYYIDEIVKNQNNKQ